MKKILILIVLLIFSCTTENSLECGNKNETVFPYMNNITLSREIKKENYSKFDIKVDSLFFDDKIGHKVSNLDFTGLGNNLKVGYKGDSLMIYRDDIKYPIAILDEQTDSFIHKPYLVELDSVYFSQTCRDSIFKFKYSLLYEYMKENDGFSLNTLVLSKKRGFLKVSFQDNHSGNLWMAKNFDTIISNVNTNTNWERKQELKYSVIDCDKLDYYECRIKNEIKIQKYVEEKLKNKQILKPKPTRVYIKLKVNCKNVVTNLNLKSGQNIDKKIIKNILIEFFDQNPNIKSNCESEEFSFVISHMIDISGT